MLVAEQGEEASLGPGPFSAFQGGWTTSRMTRGGVCLYHKPHPPGLAGERLLTTALVGQVSQLLQILSSVLNCPAAGVYTDILTALSLLISPSFILEGLHKDGLRFSKGRHLFTPLWYCP